MNNCLNYTTLSKTEITILIEPYDDLSCDPPSKFVVDLDSPISSFIEFLCEKYNIPENTIFLFFNDHLLDPDSSFYENNINDGDMLRIEFDAPDFDPEVADRTLIEASKLLSEINLQASILQEALNGSDIDQANKQFEFFASFCDQITEKLTETANLLPKRY